MESLNNIGYLFASILLPLFAYKIAKKHEIKTLLKSSLSIMFCLAISIVICLFHYKREIMEILYSTTADINYSAEVFGYLLLNFFPVAILYVIGTLLTANENFRIMIYTLIVAVIINVSLNFYLITNFGAKGAGQATLITQLFMLVCYAVFCLRIFKISLNIKYLMQLLVFVLLAVALSYGTKKISFSTNNIYNLVLHFALYFACIPIFSYITGLININTLNLKVGASE
jgi:Na+-driven multidrug efflux pump